MAVLPSPRVPTAEQRDDTPGLITAVLTDETAFGTLGDEWDELVENSDQRVFFLRFRWNQLWWKYFRPPQSRLELITCRDRSQRLVGLAPLYRRSYRTFGVTYASELLFLGMGVPRKTSEYLDVVARRGAEQAVAGAVIDALSCAAWDRLRLFPVPGHSTMLPHLSAGLGARARIEVCDRAPYIDTSTNWNTFKSGLSRSMRRNVEYYDRRLFRAYPGCQFERVTSADALETGMNALADLHQVRWQAKGEPGAFSPRFRAFLQEATRDAFCSSRLALWTLKIQGRIEAALVGFLDNGVLHFFQKGFNPAFAKYHPGFVLLALCLRDCFEDPAIRSFDFMGGPAAYKGLWASHAHANVIVEMTRPTFGAALFDACARAEDAASAAWRGIAPTSLRTLQKEWFRRRRCRDLDDEVGERKESVPPPLYGE
jgi:CelD/BcsL family acetyltransferase involved in cellulose biosynthesis